MPDRRPAPPIRRATSPNPHSQMIPNHPSPLSAADNLHPREAERPVSMMSFQSNGTATTAGVDNEGGRPERGRKKRLKGPHETLIFVRPPPTGKTPAMNVQIQLVAPGAGRGRAASDISSYSVTSHNGNDESPQNYAPSETAEPEQMESLSPPSVQEGFGRNGRPLSRSSSIKSNSSMASNATGASSSKKRIVPLYNLNFHTVLTTVITDAGTDAKVAKFLKRSVEITGVGVLEPYEQWPPLSSSTTFAETSPASLRNNIPLPSDPTSPRLSLDGVFTRKTLAEATGSEPKKLFGRFWGGGGTKKEKPAPSEGTTSDFSFFRSGGGGGGGLFGSKQSPATPPPAAVPPTVPEGTPISTSTFPLSRESTNPDPSRPQPYIGVPTLGTSPIVRPALEKAAGTRPSAYVWTVNKWASPNDAWSFATLADSLSPSAAPPSSSSAQPTTFAPSVRFEWVRGVIRPSRSAPPSNPDVRRRISTASVEPRSASRPRQLAVGEAQGGSRPNSPRGSKTSLALSVRAESPRPSQDGEKDEEEEDPEDSEVPWHCYVKNSAGTSCFLGTLSPAPHHPKVLAQLKTPYPIPSFALPGLKVKDSISSDALKDVVTTTAMWLLVREEWGGIGKKGKKA